MAKVADDQYEMTVALKVGPIKSTFSGTVTVSNEDPPQGYSLRGEGHGSAGSAQGHAHVALAAIDDTTTNLAYHIATEQSGEVGNLDDALIETAARTMAAEFFSRLSLMLEGNGMATRSVQAQREAGRTGGEAPTGDDVLTAGAAPTTPEGAYRDEAVPEAPPQEEDFTVDARRDQADAAQSTLRPIEGAATPAPASARGDQGAAFGGMGAPRADEEPGPLRFVWRTFLIAVGVGLIYLLLTDGI